MTRNQALGLMHLYAAKIERIEDTPDRHLDQLKKMASRITDEYSIDKVMRCLGFMQGVLYAYGWYTLEELKTHSRRAASDKKVEL